MKNIVLAYFSVLVVFNSWQGVTARKPSMTPSGEVLIQEGAELRIECQGEGELQFSTQEIKLYSDRQSKFEILKDENSSKLTFVRNRTKKEDTGWYACAEKGVKITNDEQNIDHQSDDIAWVYVYVNSMYSFAIETFIGHVTVIQGGRVVIPCRPTSPTVPVKLDVTKNTTPTRSPKNMTYDPKIGFIINNIGKEFHFDLFCCETNDSEKKFARELLEIPPCYFTLIRDPWASPRINHNSTRHVVWGKNVTLECDIDVPEGIEVTLSWTVPESVSKGRWSYNRQLIRVGSPKLVNHYTQSTWKSELTIRNYEKSDDGEYHCIAADHVRYLVSSVEIKSWDPDYTYINVTVDGSEDVTLEEKEDVEWKIKIKTYPENFTWTWYNSNGRVIISSNGNTSFRSRRFSHTKGQHHHNFKISNLSDIDSGNYSIKFSTEKDEKTITLHLTVLSRPTVMMTRVLPFHSPGELVTFTCRTMGSPLPNVTWFIEEYPDFPSNGNTQLKLLRNYTTRLGMGGPYHVTSKLEVNVTQTGVVACISCNELDCVNDTNRVVISDVGGLFGIIDPGLVSEGDDVRVTCGASVYNFTDTITWKPEDREDQGFHTSRIHLNRRKTNFTSQSILEIHDVKKTDEGKYICEAVTIEGTTKRKEYQLVVKAGLAPRFTNNSMQHTNIMVDLEQAGNPDGKYKLQEHCFAEGSPTPQVTWYKNDELLIDSHQYRLSQNNNTLQIQYFRAGDSGTYTCRATNRIGTAERCIEIRVIGKTDSSKPQNSTLENTDSQILEKQSHALFNSSISIFVIIVVIVIGFMGFKLHREKILRLELLDAASAYFQNGKVRCSSRESDEADRSNLLPDDERPALQGRSDFVS